MVNFCFYFCFHLLLFAFIFYLLVFVLVLNKCEEEELLSSTDLKEHKRIVGWLNENLILPIYDVK